MTTHSEVRDNREIVWLEVKAAGPAGVSVDELANNLGMSSTQLNSRLNELWKARLVDRRWCTKPSNNHTGISSYYIYTTTVAKYVYKTPASRPTKKRVTVEKFTSSAPTPDQAVLPWNEPTLAARVANCKLTPHAHFNLMVDTFTVSELRIIQQALNRLLPVMAN